VSTAALPTQPIVNAGPIDGLRARFARSRMVQICGLVLLTCVSIVLHGYHPYVVDASIYLAGVEKSIEPGLFGPDGAFVAVHANLSVFSTLMAWPTRWLHVPLDVTMLVTYFLLLAGLLLLCYEVGQKLFDGEAAGWGAALSMAVCMPIPVAATSLLYGELQSADLDGVVAKWTAKFGL
jgi:hypothetical protein